ncbi:hypothetical protein [Limimaricola hongkongensis]|uniref:Uncharacterized protein n=1 Tax=Limimaricola hongkongensis DSM 17492 TaxID=1122180 RepID=A0A017HAT4_9RHOB|nr:hypothetical protein [Limimaricola hongkongensis]EYD71425.1 hypothetical protein Lokhon_03074 [Limimaricola hongkongensis DSM 17492]
MALDQRFAIKRDSKGRFCGAGAYPSAHPALETDYTCLSKAAQRLQKALETAERQQRDAEGADDGIPTVVVRASPGAGKSTEQRRRMAGRVEASEEGRVVFHVPTLALAEEAAGEAAALGLKAQAIRGRAAARSDGSGPMCKKVDVVERASRLGISVRENFCERKDEDGTIRRCPHFEGCAYLAQFQSDATHAFLASTYLRLPDPSGQDCTQRIVDESFWRELVWIRDIEVGEFLAPRPFLFKTKAAQHADLLMAAGEVTAALMAGGSPLSLPYTAEDFDGFAKLEREARPPVAELAPDQDTKNQKATLVKAELVHRQVSLFSAIWSVLADTKRNGLVRCERLRHYMFDGKPVLRVIRKRTMPHSEPMLVLDADADREILTAVGCNVIAEHELTLRPNAIIQQLHDRRMSTTSLLGSEKLREEWRRIIAREVLRDRLGNNSGVLVGATKKVVRTFFEDAGHDFGSMTEDEVSQFMLNTRLHGAHWLWFGGRALGSNRYKTCSSVIVIGREELPVSALEDQGRALWGDTPGRPLRLIEADEKGNLRLPEEEVQYEMTDGSAMAVLVPCHPDPRIRRLQLQARELATRQMVERLRLARSDRPKRVILGCSIPIPGLPVDALVSWDDLCPCRVQAAVITGLVEKGVVRLSHKGLSADAPQVFRTENAVKCFLGKNKKCAALRRQLKEFSRMEGCGPAELQSSELNARVQHLLW